MKEEDKAYIAALIDVRSSFSISRYKASKNGHYYLRLVLKLENSHRPTLEWVLRTIKAKNLAICNVKVKDGRQPRYSLQLMNARAKMLLEDIRPYVKAKAEKLDRLLSQPHSGRAQDPSS